MGTKNVFYTWSSRSVEVDKKAEIEIRLMYQNDDYSKIPIILPPIDEWVDRASQARTLMVLDCYNQLAEESGAMYVYDAFLHVILPKFTALEELHWHNAYLKGDKSRLAEAINVHQSMVSKLRVLSLPFATTTPAGLMHLCRLTNLERLDLRCSILPNIKAGSNNQQDNTPDTERVRALPYDDIIENIMNLPKLQSLNIGQANAACKSLLFEYALSETKILSLQDKYKEVGKKISINTFDDTLGAGSDDEDDGHGVFHDDPLVSMSYEQRNILECMIKFYEKKCTELGIDYQELRRKVASGDKEAIALFESLFQECLTTVHGSGDDDDEKDDDEEEEDDDDDIEEDEEENEDIDWDKIWDISTKDMDPERARIASILRAASVDMNINLGEIIDRTDAGDDAAKEQMHALMRQAHAVMQPMRN